MQGSFDEMAPELFGRGPAGTENVGYRSPVVSRLTGITYRRLDYWARTGLVEPSARAAAGSGSARLYSFKDIVVLNIVKKLLEAGISLQNVRVAVEHLRDRGVNDLAATTLFSDGTTVYECTHDDEVLDLLRGGQGVFGIALGPAMADLTGRIHAMALPTEAVSALAPPTARHAG